MAKASVFAELIAPTTPEVFFSRYREQALLLLQPDQPGRFASLLDLDALEAYIFEGAPRREHLQVVREGPVDPAEYVYPSGLVDAVAVGKLYEQGCSIVLPQAHGQIASLTRLTRHLEAELGCRVQANVYLSPPGESAFVPHYDKHDVFALQAHGSKRWTTFKGPQPIPALEPFDPKRHAAGPEIESFTMHDGDVCYLPRGQMHQAAAVTTSLHVTVGVHWVTRADLLRAALDRAEREQGALLAALPHQWWSAGEGRDAAVEELAGILDQVADADTATAAMDHLFDDLVATRQPLVAGQFAQLAGLDAVGPDTRVAPRTPLVWKLTRADGGVVLHCYGSEISLPAATAAPLQAVLEAGSEGVAVADLPGDLDDEERLVLVRRLIREGVAKAL